VLFDAVVPAGFAESLPVPGGDGAAFELEHLEVAGDGAADDADAVVWCLRSPGDVGGGADGLGCLP
jgi:hypothetical protein